MEGTDIIDNITVQKNLGKMPRGGNQDKYRDCMIEYACYDKCLPITIKKRKLENTL